MNERRRHSRIRFESPVRGTIGGSSVYVVDASPCGFAIVHASQLATPDGLCRVEISSEFGPIVADCEIVRTTMRAVKSQPARQVFQSGLAVLGLDRQSEQRLRTLFS